MNLRRFERGEHRLTAVLNEARSAPNAKQVKSFSASIYPSEPALIARIADLRDYQYAEVYSELENAAISGEAQISDAEKYSSDAALKQFRVSRPGCVRIALRLSPRGACCRPISGNDQCRLPRRSRKIGGRHLSQCAAGEIDPPR